MFINPNINFDNVAIESYNGSVKTYAELEFEAEELKRAINQERATVLIIADKSIESVSMYYYCLANRYVPFVIDEQTNDNLLASLIFNYRFNYIFCRNSKTIPQVMEQKKVYKFGEYSLFPNYQSPHNIHPDLALLMSTSGSTGSSKSVRVTYKNLQTACAASADFYGTYQDDIGMMVLPMAYCFGQVFLLIHFMKGAKICVSNYSVFENEFWKFFDKSQITNFFCVPYTSNHLKRLNFFERDYPSLRYICQGGGKSDYSVIDAFCQSKMSKHCEYFIVYGQTEAIMISSLPSKYLAIKPDSVGVSLPNINVSIRDNLTSGEIVVQGDNIFLGYAETYEDLSRGDEIRGTLFTGDIGTFDEDGCLYILGRKSRFSKIAGLRISHDEIERILRKGFSNLELACIGNDNLVVIACGGVVDTDVILNHISKSIHLDKHFIKVICLENLPHLVNGKVDYQRLKKEHL